MNDLERNVNRLREQIATARTTQQTSTIRVPVLSLPGKVTDGDYAVIVTELKKDTSLTVFVDGHQPGFPGTGAFVIRW